VPDASSWSHFVGRCCEEPATRAFDLVAWPAQSALFGTTWQHSVVLLSGLNHVAVLTGDTERFLEFYRGVFGITHEVLQDRDGFKLTLVWIGPTSELNVFELADNTEHERQVPMFARGRLDHLALEAASLEAFDEIRERLLARGATDGFVTDFGHILSLFFRDPDGLEAEVCVRNPDAQPGVHNPPGTPALRFHPAGTAPPGRLSDRPGLT
jgi:catechol 2,3-dioxygenase-like lactoylglutathione lyase family enzyme